LEDARLKAAATPAAPVANATPEPAAIPETPSGEVDGLVDSAIDELFKGNEAEAKRLLKQAVSQRPSHQTAAAAPNTDQIAAAVEQKVVVRSALRQFAKDYPTIYADPMARKIADDFLAEATEGRPLEGFPEERIGTILKETGERVLSWTRGLVGVPANGPTATTRTVSKSIAAATSKATATTTSESTATTASELTASIAFKTTTVTAAESTATTAPESTSAIAFESTATTAVESTSATSFKSTVATASKFIAAFAFTSSVAITSESTAAITSESTASFAFT
jgi:hypothetical protein